MPFILCVSIIPIVCGPFFNSVGEKRNSLIQSVTSFFMVFDPQGMQLVIFKLLHELHQPLEHFNVKWK